MNIDTVSKVIELLNQNTDATTLLVNTSFSLLTFLLDLITIITVIITLNQNKKMLRLNGEQLKEMRQEYQLSAQPILMVQDEDFIIERPRFYYSPPEDSYDFQTRYIYRFSLKNVSSATAICVDASATIILVNEGDRCELEACTKRRNIIPLGDGANAIDILFPSDHSALVLDALRECSANQLPRIKLKLTFMNTCGGYFTSERTALIMPSKEDDTLIRGWHTCIASASVEAKELIAAMRKESNDELRNKLFTTTKAAFDSQLGEENISGVHITPSEIPQAYIFKSISRKEYEAFIENYAYSQPLHKEHICQPKVEHDSLQRQR